MIERYGYIDTNGRPSLYCTANSKPNNQGFLTKVEQGAVRLYHLDGSLVAEWPGDRLINRFENKMPELLIVNADTRINSERKEEFWFKEAYLLTEPDVESLLDLIKKDIIIVDIRRHLRESRVVRNHGTGFRIDGRFWNLCFGNREKLI